MPIDVKKLTPGEMLVAAAGILLLIFSFFKWYGVDFGTEATKSLGINASFNRNGWQSPDAIWSFLAVIIGVVMAAQVIATKLAGVTLPDKVGGLGWGQIHLFGGLIALVFVLIKLLMNTDYTKIGLWLGLVASAGLAVGGYLIAKERNELPSAIKGMGSKS